MQSRTLRTPKAFGAWLQVGDERFNSSEIERLYEASDFPAAQTEKAGIVRTARQLNRICSFSFTAAASSTK